MLDGVTRSFTLEKGKENILDAGLKRHRAAVLVQERRVLDVPRQAHDGRGRHGRQFRARGLRSGARLRAHVPELSRDRPGGGGLRSDRHWRVDRGRLQLSRSLPCYDVRCNSTERRSLRAASPIRTPRATLERALAGDRASAATGVAYSESPSPKVYGEGAAEAGKAAFDALLGKPFELDQPGTVGTVGRERSPFGIPLGITYPKADVDALFAAVGAREREWRKAGPEAWVGVCARDPATRINKAELPVRQRRDAHDRPGVHDGVPGGRAARAGPRARSHRLRVGRDDEDPAKAQWEKPQGKNEPLRMEKHFRDRAARHRPRHRLLHVSDVERLSRASSPISPPATPSS